MFHSDVDHARLAIDKRGTFLNPCVEGCHILDDAVTAKMKASRTLIFTVIFSLDYKPPSSMGQMHFYAIDASKNPPLPM